MMQMEEESRLKGPSDGKYLASLIPPELQRPQPPEGPRIIMEGREDFNKPPQAPNWMVMGQKQPNPNVSWYGATAEEGPMEPPSAAMGKAAPEPPSAGAPAPVPSNISQMQPGGTDPMSPPTAQSGQVEILPPGYYNLDQDHGRADLSSPWRTEQMTGRHPSLSATLPRTAPRANMMSSG